ncbi:MAG: aminotransferase class I/II-fold pyridoxal phosphate-dependent enzyme [Parcubacteria group bacterium]
MLSYNPNQSIIIYFESLMEKIRVILEGIKSRDWMPDIKVITGISSDPEVVIDGRKVLLMCSGNYLGLANDPRVKRAVVEGIEKYGLHPAGSRLVSGTQDIHLKVEKVVAQFKKQEDAMIFTTGTLANLGTIPALVDSPLMSVSDYLKSRFLPEKSFIFSDKLNHATIIDGCRISKAHVAVYQHADMKDLEAKIKNTGKGRKLIVSDGVFSMDGDSAPLAQLVSIAREYNALLMIDDAHGTGVIGENGGGITDYFHLHDGVDIHMGTFSKAFGLLGGFIAGKGELIEYLRIAARTYVFSGAFWGSIVYAIQKSLDIIINEQERRKKLLDNAAYLRNGMKRIGYVTLGSITPIIPIMVWDEIKAKLMSEDLFQRGILCPSIRFPAVEKGKSRIRFAVMATHSQAQLDHVLNVLSELKRKYK